MPRQKLPEINQRNVRLVLRLTKKEANILTRAAAQSKLDIAKFVRMAIGRQISSNRLPNDFPDVI